MPPKQNSKQAAGNARKAETEAAKQQKLSQQQELEEQKDWAQGANQRGASRSDAAAVKEAEAARKRAEKAKLLEEEELAAGGAVKIKKAPAVKKKNKNDLGLLDGFASEAEQKLKAKKKAEAAKKEKEEALLAQKRAEKEAIVVDPLLLNTESMLASGGGRAANKEAMQEAASGIDSALDFMSITGGSGGGGVEIKSRKALYMAFEERTMAEVKADYPGLRLTQYKERIFALWKKSPENPENQLEKK